MSRKFVFVIAAAVFGLSMLASYMYYLKLSETQIHSTFRNPVYSQYSMPIHSQSFLEKACGNWKGRLDSPTERTGRYPQQCES
ncbi:hypothetical protein F4809DRAFT_634191 [Biscogniauxia mediterranea]|nr:hypothetical protein F4809DRAFT_634191 [Biscogniauxia mediterranea]